jgi:hypothetical protein
VSAVVDHGGVLPPSPSAATSDTRLCAPFPGTRVVVRVARFCCTTPTVLNRAANTTVDHRTRGAVMADTLVERVTDRPAGTPEPVAVNLVLSDETLLGGDNTPAVVEGYGPIPAGVARSLVDAAVTDDRSRATLRRLYRHPRSGALVAMESQSRCFPRGLAKFIGLRDLSCRTPYCDAPIRHRDHAQPRNRGGPTSARNGLGMCERCKLCQGSNRLARVCR